MTDEQLSASLSSKEKYEVITHTFDIQLISTKGYNYPFEFFNPVQSMVYPFKDENCNIVISASTSAGKTICAELLMEEIFRG
jgi:replicative superfamily II helicase